MGRFLLRSVRRLVAAAVVVVAVGAAVTVTAVSWLSSSLTPDRAATAPATAAAAVEGGCAAAAARFADVVAGHGPGWVAEATPLVTSRLATVLPSVGAADLPSGRVGVVSTVAEPAVCDATVTIGGAPWRIELEAASGAWLVSAWDDGS